VNFYRGNIIQLIGSGYASKATGGIIVESPISQASIWRREEVQKMTDILVHIMTTAASGCIVAFFAYWLRKRDDK